MMDTIARHRVVAGGAIVFRGCKVVIRNGNGEGRLTRDLAQMKFMKFVFEITKNNLRATVVGSEVDDDDDLSVRFQMDGSAVRLEPHHF